MASSKGWRVDGLLTPYVRVCVRVHARIMRPLKWGADGDSQVFIFAVEPSYSFFGQAIETTVEDFWPSAEFARVGAAYAARSKIAAMPCPPPMHMVSRP